MIEQTIVGIVTRAWELGGDPTAKLRPLAIASVDDASWEKDLTVDDSIDSLFPNSGHVLWPRSHGVEVGTLWQFHIKEQPDFHSERNSHEQYIVDPRTAKPCVPVLDLSELGGEQDGRCKLSQTGVRLSDKLPKKYIIRSEGNLWLETELQPSKSSAVSYLISLGTDKMTRWIEWSPETEPFQLACTFRDIRTPFCWQLLPPKVHPQGETRLRDWSPDSKVLGHLLDMLRKSDPEFAKQLGLTKSAIKQAVNVLKNGSNGISNPGMQAARLKRAGEYVNQLNAGDELSNVAKEIIDNSPLQEEIEAEKEKILKELLATAKEQVSQEIKVEFSNERDELERIHDLVKEGEQNINELDRKLGVARTNYDDQLRKLEERLSIRLKEMVDNAEEIVASAAVIRAITGSGISQQHTNVSKPAYELPIAELQRESLPYINDCDEALNNLKRSLMRRDVPFEIATPILSSFLGGLVPVFSGDRSFDALCAFAECATGGNITWIPVSPGWIDPSDFLGKPPGSEQNHPCGLIEILLDNNESDELKLVVLDGINVAPAETVLLPLLECHEDKIYLNQTARSLPAIDARDPKISRVAWPENVLLAAIVSPSGNFPINRSFWDLCPLICVNAFNTVSFGSGNEQHPDSRVVSSEQLTGICPKAWKQWISEVRARPLKECADLLAEAQVVTKINRRTIDSALRYFSAASVIQGEGKALQETAAFSLLPHLVADNHECHDFLKRNSLSPDSYDLQVAIKDFIRINEGT
ncbi:MAG: hypothetical protein COA78_12610 [Blastopirellula sp.]|nr:MAG: hypothetical protein COA78_12610 [Blastopirellula sp.]